MSTEPSAHTPPRKAEHYAAIRDWPGYFRVVLGKPARETLVAALDAFRREGRAPGFAVDLGCGEGRDTLELVRRGWRVLAIDGHPDAFVHLERQLSAGGWRGPRPPRVAPEASAMAPVQPVAFQLSSFADARWPACDLLNCSFSLPFCEPAQFPGLWGRIRASIGPGGRFAGQFFGDRDTWAALPDRTHHSRAEIDALLAGMKPEMINEEERDSQEVEGTPKHWHVFHVVAKRDEHAP